MKTKIVEITKTEASIKMVRMDIGSVFMFIMVFMLVLLVKVSPPDVSLMPLVFVAIGVLLLTGSASICISSFCKSEIQALNIFWWPLRKYILKEGKDE